MRRPRKMRWARRRSSASGVAVSASALFESLTQRLADAPAREIVALLVLKVPSRDRRLAVMDEISHAHLRSHLATCILAILRPGDQLTFVSREEIWVLLRSVRSAAVAELAANTLLERLRTPLFSGSGELQLEPAVGVVCARTDQCVDAGHLAATATEAAHQASHADPRLVVRMVTAVAADETLSSPDLVKDLRRALDRNELEMHFQPQVDLATGRCHAAEALVRWQRPDGRQVPAALLVEVCERGELIGSLTRFTLHACLRKLQSFAASGFEPGVSLNLSAIALQDPALPLLVEQALGIWDIPASRLTLELTESALIRNTQVAGEAMRALSAQGCRLAIDDFGTGYSPYTYLRQFSFDELKLDQIFVRRMTTDIGDRRLVRSLIDLANTFGMTTVAEGVEDEATRELLAQMGCTLGQGWVWSPALPSDGFLAWCTRVNGIISDSSEERCNDEPTRTSPGSEHPQTALVQP